MWNPFRSKLAAAILGGVDKIHMPPGSKVLYLGAASGTTVSHVSDIVGPVSTMHSEITCINWVTGRAAQENILFEIMLYGLITASSI